MTASSCLLVQHMHLKLLACMEGLQATLVTASPLSLPSGRAFFRAACNDKHISLLS